LIRTIILNLHIILNQFIDATPICAGTGYDFAGFRCSRLDQTYTGH